MGIHNKSTLKLEIEKMRKNPTGGAHLTFGFFSRISGSEWLQSFDITRIDAIEGTEEVEKVKIEEFVPPALPPVTPPPSETEEVTGTVKTTEEKFEKRAEESLKEVVPQKKSSDDKNKSKSKKKKNKSKKSKTEQKDLQVKSPTAEDLKVTKTLKKPEEKSHIQIDQKIKVEKEVTVKKSVNKDHATEETEDIPITILKPKFPGGAELPDRLQKFEGQLQHDSDLKLDSDKQEIIKKSLEVAGKTSDSSSSSSSDSSANENEEKSEGTIEGKQLRKQKKSKKTKKWERMMTKIVKPEKNVLEKSEPAIKQKIESEKTKTNVQSKETEVKIKKKMRKQSSSSSLPSVKMSSDEEILVYLDLFNDMKAAKEGFQAFDRATLSSNQKSLENSKKKSIFGWFNLYLSARIFFWSLKKENVEDKGLYVKLEDAMKNSISSEDFDDKEFEERVTFWPKTPLVYGAKKDLEEFHFR